MGHNTTIASGATSGGSFGGTDPKIFSAITDNATVDAAAIAAFLNAGTGVNIATTQSGPQAGDLTVSGAVNKTAGGFAALTLTADHSVIVNQQIAATAGTLGIALKTDGINAASSAIEINAALTTNGGFISLNNSQAVGNAAGISFNADVNAGAGNLNITLAGSVTQTAGAITANAVGVVLASTVVLAGAGNAIAELGHIFAFQNVTVVDGSGGLTVSGAVTANTGTLSLSTVGDLTTGSLGTLGGAAGVSLTATGAMTIGAEIFSAFGTIQLLAASGVTFSGSNAGAYAVTLVNADSNADGVGTFTVDATGARFFGPSAVNVTAADIVLNGNLQADTVALQPSQTTATIGIGGTGSFALSAAELGKFAPGADVTIGAASNTGGITVGGTEAASAPNANLTLLSGGTISVDATRGLSAANLTLTADSIALNGGALAASGTVTLRPVTVGTLINLGGADAAGTLGLTNAELATVAPSTALVRIGSIAAGNITISNPISLENDTVLETGGSISQTAGSAITLTGTLGAASDLTVMAASPTLLGVAISGSGKFIQGGFGTVTLAAANTYTGGTSVNTGTLLVNGSIVGTTTVNPGATLGGTGSTAAVTVAGGGTLSPGASAGTLSTGNVSFANGAIFKVELGGTAAGSQYDQLNVTGSVTLSSGTPLDVSLINGFNPAAGNSFTIINNDGTDAISGQFAGLSEGATFFAGGKSFSITYHGGSNNNDVVLTLGPNQPPVNSIPGSKAVAANAGSAITASVSDPDALAGLVTTTLSVGHGTLTAASVGGASVSGSGSAAIAISGTVAQVNAALAANNVIYTPTREFFGVDTLTMTTNDNGNTGPGGPRSDTDPMTLNVGTILADVPGRDSQITAAPGTFLLDGRDGIDRVIFNFRLADAQVSYVGNKIVVDAPGGYHTVLVGIERFTFTDGTVENNDSDPLVDDLFYYSHNHDVWNAHADADAHYHASGWREGRDPSAFFSTSFYLSTNQDVRASGADPLRQFDQGGWKEGRLPSTAFDPAAYLAANPDVKAAGGDPLAHFLRDGAGEGRQPFAATKLIGPGGFDYIYYLQHNPDVAASGVDPLRHFQQNGWHEGRNPNAYFDINGYLANYTDVRDSGINPVDHYNQFGWREGRDPSTAFDTTAYRDAYPDIAAANINPLLHFLVNGINEGRSPFGDGVWG